MLGKLAPRIAGKRTFNAGVNSRIACGGRLSLASAQPVPIQDQVGKTTIYFSPYLGNQISLFDGVQWNAVTFAETSIALGTLTSGVTYDLFAYDRSGTLAFDPPVAWKLTGQAITAASNATPIVITSNSHGLANGDQVYVSGVQGNYSANGMWTAANVTTNTLELSNPNAVGVAAYTATTGSLAARATPLVMQDGVLVKSGNPTRLYVGSFYTTATTTTEDSQNNRYLFNQFNRVRRVLRKFDASSHPYATATTRQWNNSTANQANFLIGWQHESVGMSCQAYWGTGSLGSADVGQALNSVTTANTISLFNISSAGVSVNVILTSYWEHWPAAGKNYIAATERALTSVSVTFNQYDLSGSVFN